MPIPAGRRVTFILAACVEVGVTIYSDADQAVTFGAAQAIAGAVLAANGG